MLPKTLNPTSKTPIFPNFHFHFSKAKPYQKQVAKLYFVLRRFFWKKLGEVRRISSQIARHLEQNQTVVVNFGVYEPLPGDESGFDDADADVDTSVDDLNDQF